MSDAYVVVGSDGLSEIRDEDEVLGLTARTSLSSDAQAILSALENMGFLAPGGSNPAILDAMNKAKAILLDAAYRAVGMGASYQRAQTAPTSRAGRSAALLRAANRKINL